eukprot:1362697-Pyramimonas_sp.AAC.4
MHFLPISTSIVTPVIHAERTYNTYMARVCMCGWCVVGTGGSKVRFADTGAGATSRQHLKKRIKEAQSRYMVDQVQKLKANQPERLVCSRQ